jgi:hypothetical protein
VLPPNTADDFDALLAHFAAPLPADRRGEFSRAAQTALAGLRCPGPGLVHRILAELVRGYFIPPIADDDHGGRKGVYRNRRPSKLVNAAPIA